MPAAREKKMVLSNTSAIRQNSPAVTPPIVKVVARTGKIAISPWHALSERANSFPNTTS